jgi:3D (Asp-Asp-Asp) domain-containing protein
LGHAAADGVGVTPVERASLRAIGFMDERQRPIPFETLPTRLVRFATVLLCASLCSAVVGAVGVKPSGAPNPRTHASFPAPRAFEPVEMVPVKVTGLPPRGIEAITPIPSIAAPADLLGPVAKTRPEIAPALRVTPPSAGPKRHQRVLRMEVTAYCHCIKCCGPAAQGVTASGKPVSYNSGFFVAADTNLLPFGTKLIIPGYAEDQPVEVIDRGGAIKGYRLDVYYPSHEVALEWGRRFVNVIVLE